MNKKLYSKPDFVHKKFKWYSEDKLNNKINSKEAENLPILENIACFRVIEENGTDEYVLIDNKQNILKTYKFTIEGYRQMEAFINILKISKHYDEYEKANF